MLSLLLRSAVRFHLQYPLQFLLSMAGIALGVAVFVGVDVANTSATAAFESSANFVRGAATHRLLPLGDALDEQIFLEHIAARGIVAAPIIELPVEVGEARVRATLLGVDAIEEAGFRETTRLSLAGGSAPADLIAEPATVIVTPLPEIASTDESLTIHTATGTHRLRIAGRIPESAGVSQLLVVDIATAQEVADMRGRLSRIDLILEAAQVRDLQSALPGDAVLVAADNTDAAFRELSNAFRINILALGLLALAIGMFLVYSSASFSLVTRAHVTAVMHVLGTARRHIAASIAMEFLLLGLAASATGVILGHSLAGFLVELMLFTIDDFAFRAQAAVGSVSPWLYARGLAIGTIATLVAAIGPIRHAVQRDSAAALRRSSLETGSRSSVLRSLIAAGLCLIPAAVLLIWPTRSLSVAFVGLFAVLLAAASATPACSVALVAGLNRLAQRLRGFIALQATRNVLAQQSRLAVATAALSLAVACVVGVGIMIGSFRASLQTWLDTTLTSDLYVNYSGAAPAAEELIENLGSDPRVAGYSLTQIASVPTASGMLSIRGFQPGTRGWGLQLVQGSAIQALEQLKAGTAVAITEPYALRNGLRPGDLLALPTPAGLRQLPVAGIYRNYDAGGAAVLMSLALLRQVTTEERIDGIGIEVRQTADLDTVEREIRAILPRDQARMTSSAGIKNLSIEIFDRTFLITEVLRILAGSVAFLGMLSALMAVQTSRRREFATLRTLGFDPAGLRRLIVTETAIVGSSAGLIAMPIGVLLAALLVFVINVRSFGWTMELEAGFSDFLPGMLLAVTAASLAGVVPAILSYRYPIADGLRSA